jgi:carbon monoxide dehydrogenase subunit G
MTFNVAIDLGYSFKVKAGALEVFGVLSHVPTSASFFPEVDRLLDLGDNTYRWEMAKIGIGSIKLQTIYASKYTADPDKGRVVWTPVKGIGNAQVSGHWKISQHKDATHVVLSVKGELEIPLPSLMRLIVAPLVEAAFEKLITQYVDNLIQHFGGEA